MIDAAALRRFARWLAPAFVVACVWLNQGVSRAHLEAMRDEPADAPGHVLRAAWYPLAFAYHRAIDEQMYFETAGVLLGREADRAWLRSSRGKVSPAFDVEPPPADGNWHAPYTEVPLEYPPVAVPMLTLPRLVASRFEPYARVFGFEMGLFLVAAFGLSLSVLEHAGAKPRELRGAGLLAAGLLLAEGCLAIQRMDAFTAFCLALALHAAVTRRPGIVGVASGLAVASKFLPALLLPALVAADLEAYRDVRAWVKLGAGFAIAALLGLGPLLLEPRAFAAVLDYHSSRGLQIESTLGIVWGSLRALAGHGGPATYSFGSLNFDDGVAMVLARACTALTLVATLGLALVLARRSGFGARGMGGDVPARARRLALALLAACLLLWLTGKVFSPQYLTWGLPLVLAVPAGRRGVGATGWQRAWKRADLVWGTIALLTLTQIYMKGYYPAVIAQEPVGLLTLVVRQAMLFALLGVVLFRLFASDPPRSSARTKELG